MFDQFIKYILGELAVIAQIPLTFAAASLVVGGIVYAATNWAYASILLQKEAKIATLEERIKLRDDQLANKLATTPPDEAKVMIEKLEARLNRLAPRHLDDAKQAILLERLRLPRDVNHRIEINHEGTCGDCNLFAAEFSAIFEKAGWSVENGMVIGIPNMPLSGIAFRVGNAQNLSQVEQQVADAMRAAQIVFDLQNGQGVGRIELLITSTANR